MNLARLLVGDARNGKEQAFMEILAWIVVGGLAGWVASMLVGGGRGGLLENIVVGVVGAFIGGLIVGLVGGQGFSGFNLGSFIVALIGAVVLLLVLRLVRSRTSLLR
jgi:uncharacterized membrane protein YeaQ/YmgE (transglycosylase-associated protein family)